MAAELSGTMSACLKTLSASARSSRPTRDPFAEPFRPRRGAGLASLRLTWRWTRLSDDRWRRHLLGFGPIQPQSSPYSKERGRCLALRRSCWWRYSSSGCMTEPEDVPLSETWTGNATLDGVAISFLWELRESAGVIAGSDSFTFDPLTVTGDVAGSCTHPEVRMTLVVHFEPGDNLGCSMGGNADERRRVERRPTRPGRRTDLDDVAPWVGLDGVPSYLEA